MDYSYYIIVITKILIFTAKAWGDSSSMPILAIHGFSDNASTFDHLIPLLPKGFYYVSLDLPSHGRSSHFPSGVVIDFFTCLREIRRVLIQLKWTQCILLAHSAGGHFCLFIAALYPEIIKKVIIIDLFPFFVITDHTDIHERLRYFIEWSFLLDKKNSAGKRKYKKDDVMLERFTDNHSSPISKESMRTLMKRIIMENDDNTVTINTDNRKDLLVLPLMTLDFHLSIIKQVKSPILIITTTESTGVLAESVSIIKASISTLKETLNSKVTVANIIGNHNVHLDHPERIAPLIEKFLRLESSHL